MSIAETGVSRSATSEVQTTWGSPALVAGSELGEVRAAAPSAALRTARIGPASGRGRPLGERAVAADHAVDRRTVDLDRIVRAQLGLELRQKVAAHVVLELGCELLERLRVGHGIGGDDLVGRDHGEAVAELDHLVGDAARLGREQRLRRRRG